MLGRTLLCAALLAASGWAWPQALQPKRIGYIVTGGAVSFPISVEPFKRGLRELGYREGQDYVLELRTAQGSTERLPEIAKDLVRLRVDVIVASTTPGAQAAMRASHSIPVVVANSADPVAAGLAKSLARPGGNVTGLSNLGADLGQKQLEMLKSALPNLTKIGVLVHPGNETTALIARNVEQAANKAGIEVVRLEANDAKHIGQAFDRLHKEKAQALIVPLEGFFMQQRVQLADLAIQHGLPTMFGEAEHVEAGGLLSFGPDIADNFRRAAGYVDRILKGAKPGELPIEQPARFQLVLNLKTARALKLSIPADLRLRADRVID